MEKYIGTLALCIIPGILAAIIHKCVMKDKKIEIKNIYFYAIVFYGIMSFVKTFKGEGTRTLFLSFNGIEGITYLHYGIPLFIAAIAIPFLIIIVFKAEKGKRFLEMYNSLFSLIIGIVFLISGVITNSHYVVVSIISFLTSIVFILFYKDHSAFYTASKKKEKVLFILPVILLWTITVMIFEPNQLILNNLDEFSIPYFGFFAIMLLEGAVFVAVYMIICVFVLSDRQIKIFGAFIFGISVAGYIQGNFLNGEMIMMDGTVQRWSGSQKIINGAIWIVIMTVAFFLVYNVRFKTICKRIVQIVCVYICLIQMLTLAFLIITTDFSDQENEFVLTTNNMLELDDENNVVVFVLDWFDQQIMDDIIEQDENFTDKLSDFTRYTNTTSRYAFTALSVPYMLTGVEWEYGMEAKAYCDYAYKNSSFLEDIQDKNYSIGIYTSGLYIGDTVKEMLLNYSNELTQKLGYKKTFSVMNDTSKYKMAPFAVKQFYFYTTDDIDDIVVNNGEYSINNDIIFHDELQRNKLSVIKEDDYNGAFKFYHLKGAHPLFTMNEDFEEVRENGTQLSQSRGALKIVYEYIEEMQKLEVYDRATIIITADHGQNRSVMKKSDIATDYDMTSTPILYVKLPDEHHQNGPENSAAPVSHAEFTATIINAVGGESQNYGKTFEQITEDEDRSRAFTYVVPPVRKYQEYVIRGDSNDAASWHADDGGQ